MVAPINPEAERIRAQAILRSFTEQREAVNLFAPTHQDEPAEPVVNVARNQDRAITRILAALQLRRRPVIDDDCYQRPAYSSR